MLQAQVNYWNLVENKRHNVATEQQAINELAELHRHNIGQETIGFFNYAESAKHNRATEEVARKQLSLGYANLGEDIRSHKANESINYMNALSNRQNAMTNVKNAQTQALKVGYDNINTQFANRTNRMNAYTNQANTTVRQMELLQTKRRNDIEAAKVPAAYMPSGKFSIGGPTK